MLDIFKPWKMISVSHPVNVWVYNHTGVPGEITAMLWVVMCIVYYVLFIKLLIHFACAFKIEYDRSEGIAAFFYWICMTFFVVVLFILNLIHALFTLGAIGISMTQFRDWWHRGAR